MKKANGILLATVALGLLLLSGCSVVKATKQPGKKDLSVLRAGTDRMAVVAELGKPKMSETEEAGVKTDLYVFTQGYSKLAKGGRAFLHAAADVYTLGLWEVIGTPTETMASGTEVQVKVTYDEEDLVRDVVVLKGEKAVKKALN